MKKSGAAVLIMLLLLTGCGDALDEKHIEGRQTEKTSQTEKSGANADRELQRYSLRIVLKNIARRPSSRDML